MKISISDIRCVGDIKKDKTGNRAGLQPHISEISYIIESHKYSRFGPVVTLINFVRVANVYRYALLLCVLEGALLKQANTIKHAHAHSPAHTHRYTHRHTHRHTHTNARTHTHSGASALDAEQHAATVRAASVARRAHSIPVVASPPLKALGVFEFAGK